VVVAGEVRSLQQQLHDSTEAVEAAHRLSHQLDRKEELVSALREEGRLGG
jgi:methyl-accepting chemotaxis protein